MANIEQARAAKRRLSAELGSRDGVTGIGLARSGDDYRVQVNVSRPSVEQTLPRAVDGVDVRVRMTGQVSAQS